MKARFEKLIVASLVASAMMAGVGCTVKKAGLTDADQNQIADANRKSKEADEKEIALNQKAKEMQDRESRLSTGETQLRRAIEAQDTAAAKLADNEKALAAAQSQLDGDRAKVKADAAANSTNSNVINSRVAALDKRQEKLDGDRKVLDAAKVTLDERQTKLAADLKAAQAMLSNNKSSMVDFLKTMVDGQSYPVLVVVYGKDSDENWKKVKEQIAQIDAGNSMSSSESTDSEVKSGRFLIQADSADKYEQFIDATKDNTKFFVYSYPVNTVKVRAYVQLKKHGLLSGTDPVLIGETPSIDIGAKYGKIDMTDVTTYAGIPTTCAISVTAKCISDLKSAGYMTTLTKAGGHQVQTQVYLYDEFVAASKAHDNAEKGYLKAVTDDVVLSYKILVDGPKAKDGALRTVANAFDENVDGVEVENGAEMVLTPIQAKSVQIDANTAKKNWQLASLFEDFANTLIGNP